MVTNWEMHQCDFTNSHNLLSQLNCTKGPWTYSMNGKRSPNEVSIYLQEFVSPAHLPIGSLLGCKKLFGLYDVFCYVKCLLYHLWQGQRKGKYAFPKRRQTTAPTTLAQTHITAVHLPQSFETCRDRAKPPESPGHHQPLRCDTWFLKHYLHTLGNTSLKL